MKFALLAAAVAANELNTFRPENWKNIMPVAIETGSFDLETMNNLEATGVVSWAQCADSAGVWTFDTAGSTYSPNPFKKGNTVSFNLKGSVSSPMHIDNYSVAVSLNGKKIDTQTFAGGDFSSSWSFAMSQKLPLITPSGHYDLVATGNGSAAGKSGVVMCATGSFDL